MRKQKLTRKQLVEHIRQIMPSDYSEYEKLAFIEYEVAKQIAFDEKYLWGDKETREKIYRLAKKEATIPGTEVKRKLICVTMAELFGYVAQKFGFDVKYQKRTKVNEIKVGENEIFNDISDKKQEHVCPVIGLSDGTNIEVDIQDDLARLQTRSKPKSFGQKRHSLYKTNIIDNFLPYQVFRKIYQLEPDEKFTDDYMIELATKLSSQCDNSIEMFESFLNDPRLNKELQNLSCIEANKFHKAILMLCYGTCVGKIFSKEDSMAIIEEL